MPTPNPARAFDAGADEALLDLDVKVPPDRKVHARGLVIEALSSRRAADLEAVGGLAAGLRLPKVESEAEVSWVRDRLAAGTCR